MSTAELVSLLVAVALAAYLTYALLRGEKLP
jgi:K+-transporting ATPase KdpF subunit